MKQRTLAAVLVALALWAPAAGRGQSPTRADVTTFVDVTVIPMDRERRLEHQTVVVRGDRIARIAPAARAKVPAGARQIDGRGKFLIPGLADMHLHLAQGTGTNDDPASQQLTLLLATGVTTVRSMFGTPSNLALRDAVAHGTVPGPTIYTAGPPLTGQSAPTPDAGRRAVEEQKAAGYDYIKVHEGLSPETYQAITRAAKRVKIPVAGHVTASVGLPRALAAHQTSIEHLDGYVRAMIPADAPAQPPPGQIVVGPSLAFADDALIPSLAKSTRDARVWNTPTLALFEIIVSAQTSDELAARPEERYATEAARQAFRRQKDSTSNIPATEAEKSRYTELRRETVRGLRDAGARLLVGSDSPQFFLVPGFAVHREMRAMVDAGLSPYEALEAATRGAAEYVAETLRAPRDWGTIEKAKRADLVLLDADPLADVDNANRIAGVLVRGRWISREEIAQSLEALAALNAPPAGASAPAATGDALAASDEHVD